MSRHPYPNTLIINIDPATAGNRQCPLLAIIDKYGVLILSSMVGGVNEENSIVNKCLYR